jgi:hypothetical protein
MKTKLLLLLVAFLFLGSAAQAQGFRVGDSYPISTSLSTPGVVSTQQATINFCAHPANGIPCINKVNTYTDIALGTACPTSTQIVLAGTTSCVGQTDSRGNWGVNIPAGTFDFTITVGGSSFGPYTVSVGVPPGSNVSVGSLTATGVNGARIVGTAAGQYASIEAALSGLTGGTIIVTDGFSETITTNVIVSGTPGVRIQVMPNASLTIGTGGSITLTNNGVWEQPGGIINVTKTSGDALLLNGGWSRLTLGQLNYTGGAGTTNAVVFAGAEFCNATINQIKGFVGGTSLLLGRTGQGNTINNRATVEFINNGGSLVTFASGHSGTDVGPFDEGNRVYLGLASVFTIAGITFGDNDTLHDAQFNAVYGDTHDTSGGGGIVPVIFNDGQYSSYDGNLFSTNSLVLATFGSLAKFDYLKVPNLVSTSVNGAGLFQNQANGLLGAQSALFSIVSPTISSGFGTSPTITAPNGTGAFNILVGSAPGNTGAITLPAAVNSWNCTVNNLTAAAGNRADNTRQTGASATSATFQNQTTSTGAAVNFTAGDTLRFSCLAW